MVSQITTNKSSPIASRKKYQAPQRPSIQELKQKYESQTCEEPKTPKPKSPKLMRKFKVKQIASMFNSKISKIIRRDTSASRYNTLINEFSPEPKPTPQPQVAALPTPLPLPRTRYTKEKAPVPSPRTKSKAKLQRKNTCFVAEDMFGTLTVKDKALLYTQFVDDMSRKNPKFGKHAKFIEANVKKEVARGEVVNEKQESVKHLLEELEARCAFPKHTVSPAALQSVISVKRQCRRRLTTYGTPVKSKEFEDIVEQKVSHISTLTVTLQHSPVERRERRARSLPRRTTEGDQLLFPDISLCEPSHKRNNGEMRSALPIEANPPSKKIRRTRAERLAPHLFFQNQQLEHLFYSWLEHEVSKTSEMDKEKQKSAIDKLLEEAIAKLETVETKQKEDVEVSVPAPIKPKALELTQSTDATPKITPRKNKTAAAATEPPKSSTTSSAKQSEAEESESGVSSLAKNTSDESQPEKSEKSHEGSAEDFDFAKPTKPMRKKKMRRTLTWKKDSSLVEANTISTTDSDSDCKKTTPNTNKKAISKPHSLELSATVDEVQPEPSFVELDKSLMRVVNSPRKIKSAYTLTVFSPPPYTEEDFNDSVSPSPLSKRGESSCSWPSLIEAQLEQDMSGVEKVLSSDPQVEKKQPEPRSLADSFDQGFETGSNEIDSPIRPARKASLKRQDKVHSPLLIKAGLESRRSSIDPAQKLTENPSGFSTPIKTQGQQNFNHSGIQQQLFSPISLPLKNRRRSIYDNESRRSSLAMQVIREDQPLEQCEIQSPRTINNTDAFFANAPTMDMTTEATGVNGEKTSSFWIKAGDFSIALDIYYNEADRVKLLYEIFSQRSCDTRDLHFGIDDHKFSVHDGNDDENISKRLPQKKETSHYWFSTGDLAIPFSGKMLTSEKIQRLFQFIKSSVEETGILRFGVDQVEFSNVPEFWTQSPKYSMESNYSMLVGLQSGNSNGLEGRSKYAWPHSKPVPVSDLDQSDFECNDFEETESTRLSFSPFGSNVFDLASLGSEELMMPRNSDAMMMSSESFCMGYENEPLDQLFDDKNRQDEDKDITVITPAATVPEMLNTLQTQQQRLSSVKERLSCYSNLENLSSDALDALKGTPEYLVQLKNIVSDISSLGCNNGFRDCTLEELERYMFFLSRYADICLNSCSSHMDRILDALLDHRAVTV